ncbi:MAG TPA: DUF4394 domain-containing protein [Pyrinomonadaceae bacterium]|jgi:hypothetical protein
MNRPSQSLYAWAVSFVLFLFVFAAGRTETHAVPVAGLTNTNELVVFDSATPETIFHRVTISGLSQPGERVLDIDLRPSNGRLYVVTDRSRLYTVNLLTGAATQVGSSAFTPALGVTEFSGLEIGFDFDPVADQIRVLTVNDNLRLNPDTGAVVGVDAPLTNAPGEEGAGQRTGVNAAAYSNNFAGATSTTLYALDANADLFMRIGSEGGSPVSPNTGQVFRVGRLLGFRPFFTELAGLDIAPGTSNLAFAGLTGTDAVATRLYSINLSTGKATEIGHIGTNGHTSGGVYLRGLAILSPGTNIFGLTFTNKLMLFNSAAPGVVIFSKQITGLQPGESLLAIDVRPATGQLYALGSTSRLYTINPTTAAARQVTLLSGAPPFSPALQGTEFGFDFNPVADRIRVVSNTGQNLRLNPDTGAVESADTNLSYASSDPNAAQTPRIVASAYTNNAPGANTTALYGIDSNRDTLVTQNPPNSGTLQTVGALGFNTTDYAGFDISDTGAAFAAMSMPFFETSPPSHLFQINLSTGAATNLGFIGGKEIVRGIAVAPSRAFFFSSANYTTTEDCSALRITVLRSGDASTAATVDYTTNFDGTFINPASDRSDFNAAHGTLRFAAGETFKTFDVLINEDSYNEKIEGQIGESFAVTLSNPTGGFALGVSSVASVLIIDDPQESSSNVIDDSRIFVCQHYHDFLNRDPDTSGLEFWINNIESCGTNAGCREVKRIETSAAFFRSIEFQETGFLVYRLYQAAFNTGERLSLQSFLRDTQEISRGVVVLVGDWRQQLEANKQAFANEFVNRPAFLQTYPPSMSNADFINLLNTNTGGSLSGAERDDLVARLDAGQITRAEALRRVAEDEDFRRRETNKAFVLMQYFGYLRREPNAAPDTDFTGYNFWLGKLNQFGGDFRRAEMVKAFITSGEYRRRFGQP